MYVRVTRPFRYFFSEGLARETRSTGSGAVWVLYLLAWIIQCSHAISENRPQKILSSGCAKELRANE